MVNSELVKLLAIVGIGALIVGIGMYRVHKNKNGHLDSMGSYHGHSPNNAAGFSPNLSQAEDAAKNYINQYKDSYPREALKAALIKNGNSDQEVDAWLDKYMK